MSLVSFQNCPFAKLSIIAGTSSPSGYRTGQVQPASTYSRTLARHSSGVPGGGDHLDDLVGHELHRRVDLLVRRPAR